MGIFGWDGYAGSTADSKKIVGPQLLVSSPDLCSSSYYYFRFDTKLLDSMDFINLINLQHVL